MTITQRRLANGLKLITVPLHETKAVTLLVLVKVGSRYETAPLNGSSHFIEHLLFKGTKRRPRTIDVTKELDGVGAEYNAFTSKDATGYYVKIDARHLGLAVDIVSDMLWNSTFDPKEVERERGVIIEEINMYEDNPMMHMEDLFEATVFGDHPLGWLISGTHATMRTMSRAAVLRFRNAAYRPDNMVVAVAGRFEQGKLDRLITDAFGSPRSPRLVRPRARSYRETFADPQVTLKQKETEQVQVALGFPGVSNTHPDLPALVLLATILGGNMSSRLFIQVRERRGLAYFVRAGASTYEDTGTFMVQAGLERTRVDEALTAILAELARVRDRGVQASELIRARDYLHGKLVLGLEDSEEIAGDVGRQLLLKGKVETPEQKIAKLQKVTRDAIRRVAAKTFQRRRLALAMIGPSTDREHYLTLLRRAL